MTLVTKNYHIFPNHGTSLVANCLVAHPISAGSCCVSRPSSRVGYSYGRKDSATLAVGNRDDYLNELNRLQQQAIDAYLVTFMNAISKGRKHLLRAIEQGFILMPAGCRYHIPRSQLISPDTVFSDQGGSLQYLFEHSLQELSQCMALLPCLPRNCYLYIRDLGEVVFMTPLSPDQTHDHLGTQPNLASLCHQQLQ